MVKAIAFDFDGTLGDTIPMCLKAFRESVSPYAGHMLSDGEIIQTFGLNEIGMIRAIVPPEAVPDALRDFYASYERLHRLICPEPFPCIPDLLKHLNEKEFPLALVTGKGVRTCEISLNIYGLAPFFHAIETGRDDRPAKEDSLANVLHKFRLAPDELLYVGDTVSDVESCRRAGIRCLSAAWAPSADKPALLRVNPSNVFDSIADLRTFLDQSTP